MRSILSCYTSGKPITSSTPTLRRSNSTAHRHIKPLALIENLHRGQKRCCRDCQFSTNGNLTLTAAILPHIARIFRSELGVSINVEKFLCTTEYDYPSFHLTMHCYVCSIKSGDIVLREHKSALWLATETFDDVEWLPADKSVVEILRQKN